MSVRNYIELLVRKNTTGSRTPTCFPAALDLISDNNDVPPWIYQFYTQKYKEYHEGNRSPKLAKETMNTVLTTVDGGKLKDVAERRARSEDETEEILEKAKIGGRRVVIFTEKNHVVGLKPIDERWILIGTWTPKNSFGIYSSREVFRFLAQPKRQNGKLLPNILLIKPEKKKK